MMKKQHSILCMVFLFVSILVADELGSFVQEALEKSPAIRAAYARVEELILQHQELSEFYDPQLFVAGGRTGEMQDLPLESNLEDGAANSYDIQAGIEMPVWPGGYLTVGGAHRRYYDVGGYDKLYQTLFGARLRIPLWNDRGFKGLSLSRALAMSEVHQAQAALLAVAQNLRYSVEVAYIDAYEQLAAWRTAQDAVARFQNHYEETKRLYDLKSAPQYQIDQSLMELQISRDDEEKARNVYQVALVQLAKVLGRKTPVVLQGEAAMLLQAANGSKILPACPEGDKWYEFRGSWQQLMADCLETRIRQQMAQEEQRDQIDLQLGTTMQGEDTNHRFSQHELVTDHRLAGEALLVWRRKLGHRGAKLRHSRYLTMEQEKRETLRGEEIALHAALQAAKERHLAALKRLEMVERGIDAARRNVEAEQERFRQGEGSSTNVTDAQKNLTSILQRESAAAAALLRARAEYDYALGYLGSQRPEVKVETK